MNIGHSYRHSLKTRVTLWMLAIFLASIWSLAFYVNRVLSQDMQTQLSEQQFSTVSLLAGEVEQDILTRQQALRSVAAEIQPATLADPSQLQALLQRLPVFLNLFNGGAFVTGTNGVALASLPASTRRVGINYSDRDYIARALQQGQASVGRPVVGRLLQAPVVGLAVPIRDGSGRIIGALAGVINLNEPNFLDRFKLNQYGKTGSYLLVDARHRLIITTAQKDRTMELLPPAGVSPVLDRFIQGHEGTEIFVNPVGVEVLASAKHIPEAGWYAAVAVPTHDAFAPIRILRQRFLLAALLLTLLATALSWWLLERQLAPLERAAGALAAMAGQPDLQPLPLQRQDEVGQLIDGFNQLITELSQRQIGLKESEERYRTAFRTSPDALSLTRIADGLYLDVNDGFTRLFGWQRAEVIGKTALDLGIWAEPQERQRLMQALLGDGHCANFETRFLTRDGTPVSAEVSANILEINGEQCLMAVTHDIGERQAAMAQIEQLAFSDPLTGLPNRRLFRDRLEHAMASCQRQPRHGALMFIDLDHFKMLNDTLGHDVGDQLLRQIALRLKSSVRLGDTVARFGGDEFVVLLEDLSAQTGQAVAQAEVVAEKILATIRQPCHFDSHEHIGSASIGITLFGDTLEKTTEPLKRADLAMYQAKAAGRGTLRFFDPHMQALVSQRTALEARLREALQEERFVLHYQTQVDHSGRIIGVEALVRWQDPQRGLIGPAEFIALSEETGLILPLGQWVLQTACRQLRQWADQPGRAHLTIAVNVSARQFHQDHFVSLVKDIIARSGAPAERLELELTESLLVTHMDDVIAKMGALRAVGVRFSLDDFGTGFSSLSYLKRLPLDQLKIDQGFVRDLLLDPNDEAIAGMVVALGNSLGLSVIAEGVETPAQQAALARLGCTSYQGYLFGRPQPIEQLEALLQGQPA